MIDILSVHMTALKQQRTVRVYLPKNYHLKDKRFPVLYMHDGQNVFSDREAIGGVSLGLESFLDKHEIELIVVAIDQNPNERMNEYCPWEIGEYSFKHFGAAPLPGGKGKDYVDFLVHELKPQIDQTYKTIPKDTAIAGISLGGLISTYAAVSFPQVFNKVAAFSSAFFRNQEELEKLIKESDLTGLEGFYLDCGDCEAKEEKMNNHFMESNERIYHLLGEKIQNVRCVIIKDGEHHYDHFKERVPEIIKSFL